MADQVEEVKQKTDIITLIGERVKLQRAGRNFRALCPFHSERTASFMVSSELQIFKCFGCGRAGDVYTFLSEFDGMEFPEALAYLAKRAGVRLEPFRKSRDYQRKERLWEITHLASEFFHFLLTSHRAGEQARQYLVMRGMREKTVETFRLGFAPDRWDALLRYLVGKKRYRIEELAAVGLVVQSRGKTYDRFRNRVMFPLRDVRGNVVGFAGRVLPSAEEGSASAGPLRQGFEGQGATADKQAKYINSPETELYHKSEHLYGLYENRSFVKKSDQAVIVEGEFDAISSWQANVKNVVAVKGTALTEKQVELVRRYTRNAILALDADTAGDAATKRGISLADVASLNIKVALIVGGKDPDEIAKSDPNRWRGLVERAISVYDFYFKSVFKRFDRTTGLGKKQISEELVPIILKISNAIEQAHYIKKLAGVLDVSEEVIVDEIRRFERLSAAGISTARLASPAASSAEEEKKDRRRVLEEYFLALVLQGGALALSSLQAFEASFLRHPVVRRIMELLLTSRQRRFEAGEFIASLPAELQQVAQSAFLIDLSDLISDPEALNKEIERVTRELFQFNVKEQLAGVAGKIRVLETKKTLDSKEKKRLFSLQREFSELTRKLSV